MPWTAGLPGALDEAYSDALWDELVKRAAILYRGVDLGIVLVRPSGPRHVAKRAPVSVAIVGEPGELLMHAHGRTRHALVTFEGQPDAVALLQSAEVGPVAHTGVDVNAGPRRAIRSRMTATWPRVSDVGSADFEARVADGRLDLRHHVVRVRSGRSRPPGRRRLRQPRQAESVRACPLRRRR